MKKKVHIGEESTYWRKKYILEKKVHIGEEMKKYGTKVCLSTIEKEAEIREG